jgi:Tol biopolymer transport system component
MRRSFGPLLSANLLAWAIAGTPLLVDAERHPSLDGKVKIATPVDDGVSVTAVNGATPRLITPAMVRDPDCPEEVTWVKPLSFSPDGTRLAVQTSQDGNRIYVVGEHQPSVWVTRGLLKEVHGTSVRYLDQVQTLWSPDSRKLAVVTCGSQLRISVFEGGSLQTVYTDKRTNDSPCDFPIAWAGDGSALFAAPFRGQQQSEIIRIPAESGKSVTVFSGDQVVSAMGWNSTFDTLAFNSGNSVWLYDGANAHKGFTISHWARAFYWTPDGSKLAITDFRELTISDKNGENLWNVTESIKSKWLIRNFIWIDGHRFAFILVTSEPESTKLYSGDATTKSLTVLPEDVLCANLQSIEEGFLYFKIMKRGAWRDVPEGLDSPADREREVTSELFFWDADGANGVRLANQAFITTESEGDFTAYFYPVVWVQHR